LLSRFSDNVFLDAYSTTIGIDFNSKMIRVDKAICKLEIWDTAVIIFLIFYIFDRSLTSLCLSQGQERFSTITANYYRGAQGALLVYDIGNKESFIHVQNWYDRARQLGGESMQTIMIGNKNDLAEDLREVSTLEGEEFANSLGIQFIETSALNGTNVEKAFVSMTSAVKKSVDARGLAGVQSSSMQKTGSVSITNTERKPSMVERCCR
jgi:GTPase SAR1 family protein